MRRLTMLAVLTTLLGARCYSPEATALDDQFVREYVKVLRQRDFDTALKLVSPEAIKEDTRASMERCAELLQGPEPEITVLRHAWIETVRWRGASVAYEYHIGDRWVLVEATFLSDLSFAIRGFRVTPLKGPVDRGDQQSSPAPPMNLS